MPSRAAFARFPLRSSLVTEQACGHPRGESWIFCRGMIFLKIAARSRLPDPFSKPLPVSLSAPSGNRETYDAVFPGFACSKGGTKVSSAIESILAADLAKR
jgi:hypothetical protein